MGPFSIRHFFALVAAVLLLGCGVQRQTDPLERASNPVADSLNDRAVDVLTQFSFDEADTVALRLALEDVRQATTIDPENLVYASNMANILRALRKRDAARAELERVTTAAPTAAEVMQMIGFMLEAEGRREQAVVWYERAINAYTERISGAQFPGDPAARAFAIRMAHGREAGLDALEQVEWEAEGRELHECYIKYATRREIVETFGEHPPEPATPSVALDQCLSRVLNL